MSEDFRGKILFGFDKRVFFVMWCNGINSGGMIKCAMIKSFVVNCFMN